MHDPGNISCCGLAPHRCSSSGPALYPFDQQAGTRIAMSRTSHAPSLPAAPSGVCGRAHTASRSHTRVILWPIDHNKALTPQLLIDNPPSMTLDCKFSGTAPCALARWKRARERAINAHWEGVPAAVRSGAGAQRGMHHRSIGVLTGIVKANKRSPARGCLKKDACD